MKGIPILGFIALLAIAVPAQATTYTPPSTAAGSCSPQEVGYNASGSLVSSTLTTTEDNRYDGTLVVDVKKANQGAPTGEQTFTLVNATVIFHHGVNPTEPAAGSHVKLSGTITMVPSGCPLGSGTVTPTITIKKVDISTPRKGHGASAHHHGARHHRGSSNRHASLGHKHGGRHRGGSATSHHGGHARHNSSHQRRARRNRV